MISQEETNLLHWIRVCRIHLNSIARNGSTNFTSQELADRLGKIEEQGMIRKRREEARMAQRTIRD